jgi:formate-nitrite transporter family protein
MRKAADRTKQPSPRESAKKSTAGDPATELTQTERKVARERTAPRAAVIHEAIRVEGEGELRRPVSALIWSGSAAGLSISFSLVARGLLQSRLPDTVWRPLIADLGYSVGFLAVILGRQQLYTENTLTVMLPLFTRRDLATLLQVLRLWSVVLIANLAGTCLFAFGLARFNIFPPDANNVFYQVSVHAVSQTWSALFVRGIVAGWLIALMVWMMPGADYSRAFVIIVMTYLIALGDLPHSIVGSTDGFFLIARGAASWGQILGSYITPILIGNTVGGVALVASFNHAQVVTGEGSD